MFSKKALISKEGFDYLFSLASRNQTSKTEIKTLISELYEKQSQQEEIGLTPKLDDTRKIRGDKKELQYRSLLKLIGTLPIQGTIVELGCGKGDLTRALGQRYDSVVIGVDQNQALINSLRQKNSSIYQRFLLPEELIGVENDFGLTLGLHTCGNLSDQVIELGCKSSRKKSAVICVPCCYGKINQFNPVLPRSKELKEEKEKFKVILKRASSLEGYVDNLSSRPAALLEAYRRLIDFDRIFYLNENGYQTSLVKLESTTNATDSKYSKDSLMSAIVALRN